MTDGRALPAALVDALRAATSVGIVTGAGVSAESGIRTYRGEGGLYDDPDEGDATVVALSGPTLRRDPDRTWCVVAELARQSAAAAPNPAHSAIVAIENAVERFVLLTQNVDGLHQLAGSRNIIDIHGNIFSTECMSCGRPGALEREILAGLKAAPRCEDCEGILRPGAVLFGEMLPVDKVARLNRELIQDPPDVVVIAGTTAEFPYIVEPIYVARQRGKVTVEVNPEWTAVTDLVTHPLRGLAGHWMPMIADVLN